MTTRGNRYGEPGDRPAWLDGISERQIEKHLSKPKGSVSSPDYVNSFPSSTDGQTEVTQSAARPWPSKNNPSGPAEAVEKEPDHGSRSEWWHRKNELVNEFVDEHPQFAARPISVCEGTKLREEVTFARGFDDDEDPDAERAARSVSDALREFLTWYNNYRNMHLVFSDPDGEIVRSQMRNSHQPAYGDRYYARLKAFERSALREFEGPISVVLLTLSASHKNANGGYRCPADHIREIVDSWSHHVRPALHRALGSNGANVDCWEYCRVLEHHPSSPGYGHLHIALFVDGEVSESDFHPVIDAHLRHCDPAHRSAHNYFSEDPDERPISVRTLDVDLDPEDYDGRDDVVGNLGSYVAEYIGAHGSELFDRELNELAFRATCWATGTRRVDFSPGANELIEADLVRSEPQLGAGVVGWKPGVDAADVEAVASDPDRGPSELLEGQKDWEIVGVVVVGWTRGVAAADVAAVARDPDRGPSELLEGQKDWEIVGVGIVDRDGGESIHDVEESGVRLCEIVGSEAFDPPKRMPNERPGPNNIPRSNLAD